MEAAAAAGVMDMLLKGELTNEHEALLLAWYKAHKLRASVVEYLYATNYRKK